MSVTIEGLLVFYTVKRRYLNMFYYWVLMKENFVPFNYLELCSGFNIYSFFPNGVKFSYSGFSNSSYFQSHLTGKITFSWVLRSLAQSEFQVLNLLFFVIIANL